MYAFVGMLERLNSSFRARLRFLMLVDFVAIAALMHGVFFYFDLESRLSRFAASSLPFSASELLTAVSLLIALVVVLLVHRNDGRRSVVLLIEERYPALRERLRTACDNREHENLVMDALSKEIQTSLALVRSSELMSKSDVALKLLFAGMVLLASMFITANETHVPPETLSELSQLAEKMTGSREDAVAEVGDLFAAGDESTGGGKGDIYGKPAIARLTGKKIDLLLYSGSGRGLELRSADETRLEEFEQTPRYPVDAVASGSSDDYGVIASKPGDARLLIRRYAVEVSQIK